MSTETTLIDDSDPVVQYQAGWMPDSGIIGVYGTRHGAAAAPLEVRLPFSGTGVQVFGQVGPSSLYGQPTTQYAVDGKKISTYTAPFTPTDTTSYNVSFFAMHGLNAADHELVITTTNGTAPNTFWLDFFLIDVPAGGTVPSSTASSTTSTSVSASPAASADVAPGVTGGKKDIAAIVGGVLGAIVFLLLLSAVFYLWTRVRKLTRATSDPRHVVPSDIDDAKYPESSSSPVPQETFAHPPTSPMGVTVAATTPIAGSVLHDRSPEPSSPSPDGPAPPTALPSSASLESDADVLAPHTEVSRAHWYAAPELQSRAQSLLSVFSARNSPRPTGKVSSPGEPALEGGPVVDSGLRQYNEPMLPPAYTAD
ncbi:uncharacterized protein BXZ73DRAFT_100984 [Epithele typhae]|uniref:uncharacterized protein n=1 Tax=Epithele typhae TaxID=378194 RepID=UPI0020074693|nr:uncharacterized protein BXZ73DRAFT_100984 [Epithele typhae]KAH9933602.1 hypothetical protein BXZ73DRAFT_100984 [Epithele typhae]